MNLDGWDWYTFKMASKASNTFRYLFAAGAAAAIMGTGYVLMRVTTPDKETMMKRLPQDQVDPQRMAEVERRNAEMFRVLAENTKLDTPIWQVKGRTDLNDMSSKK